MTRHRREQPADPADELRALIREAHGAAKDLSGLLRECRELRAGLLREVGEAAHQEAGDQLARFARHLQQQQNDHATYLNGAVERAQKNIVRALTLARAEPDDSGGLKFTFEGGKFKDDVPLPAAPPARPQP